LVKIYELFRGQILLKNEFTVFLRKTRHSGEPLLWWVQPSGPADLSGLGGGLMWPWGW